MLLLQEIIVYIWLLPVVMSIITPLIMLLVWAVDKKIRPVIVERSQETHVSERMVCAS